MLAQFPDWFISESIAQFGETPVPRTAGEFGFKAASEWYHITPRVNVPQVLQVGLKMPQTPQDVAFVKGRSVIPGIYLEEDEVLALDITEQMMDRMPGIELSMLRVIVTRDMKFVFDPEMTMGAIIVLQDIPAHLVSVVVDNITKELVNRVVNEGEELGDVLGRGDRA